MKRRLVTLADATSLLLCIVMVAMWVRSYRRFDYWGRVDLGSAATGQERRSPGNSSLRERNS